MGVSGYFVGNWLLFRTYGCRVDISGNSVGIWPLCGHLWLLYGHMWLLCEHMWLLCRHMWLRCGYMTKLLLSGWVFFISLAAFLCTYGCFVVISARFASVSGCFANISPHCGYLATLWPCGYCVCICGCIEGVTCWRLSFL